VGSEIRYNAVTLEGGLQLPSDAILAPAMEGVEYGAPELRSLGDEGVVAYGEQREQQGAFLSVRRFAPETGELLGDGAEHPTDAAAFAPQLGSVATTPNEIVLSSRAWGDAATTSRLSRLSTAPAFEIYLDAGMSTWATSVAWSSYDNLFGVAAITASSGSGGKFVTYASDLGTPQEFVFTKSSDRPGTASVYSVSIAAGPQGFAIAWVDQQDGTDQVYLALVDASGAQIAHRMASDGSSGRKRHPKIVFDSQNFAVAWLEELDLLQHHVLWRRFGASLEPIGDALKLRRSQSFARFGLASAGPAESGVAYLGTDGFMYISRITCERQ
jgi:hypothetical protein